MPKPGSIFFDIGYWFYTRTFFGHYYYQRELAKARTEFPNGHSITRATELRGLGIKILPIAMSEDNYAYMVVDTTGDTCVLVDPADPRAVQPVLNEENVAPVAILTTHKHWDHSCGNSHWKKTYPEVKIYGGRIDDVPSVTHPVDDGQEVMFGRLKFTVLHTPGHTVGHVTYLMDCTATDGSRTTKCLFSGDHLFISGCGRFFEASPERMLSSLDLISRLEGDTMVFPGHEYTRDNLEFAAHIEPDNEPIQEKLKKVIALRGDKQSTVPSTINEELACNPFLRTSEPSVQEKLGMTSQTDGSDPVFRSNVLAELRKRKDSFKYKL